MLAGASDTTSTLRRVKAKPKGVAPDEAVTVLPASVPSWRTRKLVSLLVAFSLITSTSPSSLKPTWAGPVPLLADKVPVAPGTGTSVPCWLRKPATPPLPPALST